MQCDEETTPQSARDRRLARDAERERVKAALRSTSGYGHYVFDELVTEEAGILDYLVVGPSGATAIVIRDDEGIVVPDPYTYVLYLDGYPFEDDPRQQANEQADDVLAKLTRGDVPIGTIICFTRADLRDCRNPEANKGIANLWALARMFGEDEETFNPAEVGELADDVERIYGRPPFVKPVPEQGGGDTL